MVLARNYTDVIRKHVGMVRDCSIFYLRHRQTSPSKEVRFTSKDPAQVPIWSSYTVERTDTRQNASTDNKTTEDPRLQSFNKKISAWNGSAMSSTSGLKLRSLVRRELVINSASLPKNTNRIVK